MSAFATIDHQVDFCVVGGGLAGLFAAISAARHGAKVALMQDRPVLGGNASSEIRMWVSGAKGPDCRETGLLEELAMENQFYNPHKHYHMWDRLMEWMARQEEGIELIMNCSCLDCGMQGDRIAWVKGWQTTTQTYHVVHAKLFADCSGDSVLAPLSGADYRVGREARAEFGERIAPVQADRKTMGMSCLFQAREGDGESVYKAPPWAEKIGCDQLAHRMPDLSDVRENYWYLELGGDADSIADTEALRWELQGLAYGLWDFLKNDTSHAQKHAHWEADWVCALPGKRESRRYVGPYMLTELDIESARNFEDIVAYGGWPMDDHHPGGFRAKEPPNVFHPAPSPYAIPYRCLYSHNIANLFFAGRNISVTHAALSSTRVMATCALCGQAVGTAAALAIRQGGGPREVEVTQLQQQLMQDDCFLPGRVRKVSRITQAADLRADGENAESLRDGMDRDFRGSIHAWQCKRGGQASYWFHRPVHITQARLVFDSDLNRTTLTEAEKSIENCMLHNRLQGMPATYPPKTLVRAYRITAQYADGHTEVVVEERENHQRLRRHTLDSEGVVRITLEPLSTWGEDTIRVFGFEVCGAVAEWMRNDCFRLE